MAANLDGGVLRSRDHDGEDGVEDDACDGRAVPTQGVSLGRARDPLLGVPLLAHGAPVGHLLLGLVQLGLQLHHLHSTRHWASVHTLHSSITCTAPGAGPQYIHFTAPSPAQHQALGLSTYTSQRGFPLIMKHFISQYLPKTITA